MKARFLALAALVLGVVSCQTEPEGLDVNVGGEQLVTINVAVPETETRAGGNNSALGVFDNGILGDANDNTTMRYILQVYYKTEENGEVKYTASKERLVEYSDGKSVAFEVRLVPERDYQFVVWADVVTAGKTDTDNHYNTKDLANIKLNNTWVAMDESRDAFTATELIEDFKSTSTIDITLKRPFAKLRVVTTDMKALNNLGIVPTKATVTYTVDHYNAFNALFGNAIGDTKNRTIKHENYAIASYGENVAEGADMTLFSDYFFAEDDVVKFDFDVYDRNGKLIKSNSFKTDIYAKRNYLTTIKGNILTDGKGFDVTIDDAFAGENGVEDGKSFANVDTAEELLDAINKGVANITLDGDIDLGSLATRATASDVLTVAAGKTITLDLNGKTISYTKECDSSYAMIENKGTLTINDSKGNGKISFKDTSAGDPTFGWGSYTLRNEGTLVFENGTIEHLGEQNNATEVKHMICAIFQYSGSTTINGGTISTPTYRSVRLWKGDMTINGGNFNGQVWVQAEDNSANLTINGGEFAPCGADGSSIFITNSKYEVQFAVTGGFFNTKIGCTDANKAGVKGSIVGGTFTAVAIEKTNSALIAPGYKAEEENGVYIVRKPQALIDFENAIANGNDVTLNEDLTLIDPVVVPEGKEVTINLNGKTLSGVFTKGAGAVITNNATLKVVGGTIKNTYTNGDAAINNSGELVLENVKIEGAPLGDGGYSAYAVISSGKITINEGTEVSADRGCLKLSDNGETIINGGTFVNNDIGSRSLTSHVVDVEDGGSNKLTINGGTFEHRHATTSGGVVICNRTKGTVYVNGGNFSGGNYYGNNNLSDYGYGGTFSVTGGVYSAKPAAKYIAAGYKVIEENGKFNVVPDEVDAVVSNAENLKKAVESGNDNILVKGEIDLATVVLSGYNGTIIGADDTAVINTRNFTPGSNEAYQLRSTNLAFKNIDVKLPTGGDWLQSGFVGTGTILFDECNFEGQATLNGSATWIFNDCTFVSTESGKYASFVYGATKATFNRCSFSGVDRAAKVYGTGGTLDIEYNTCKFTSTSLNKSGVEIDASYATTTVALNTCTQTAMAGLFALEGSKGTVLVDGYTWITEGLVKKDNEYVVSSKNGLNYFSNKTADNGSVIKLAADIDFEGAEFKAIAAGYSKSLTFDGQNHIIKNVKIATCSHNSVGSAGLFFCYTGGTLNVSNLVVEKATSEGATYAGIITGYTQGYATLTNITVKECNVSGIKKIGGVAGFIEASTSKFIAENCKVIGTTVTATEKQAGTIIGYNAKPATLKNCTVESSTATAPAYCDGGVRCTDPAQAELTIE